MKFFRWLYNPDEPDPRKRITPPVMNGIRQLKRKAKTNYEPSDVWGDQEYAIFLRFCPSKRDRCYVAMNRDTAGRPSELLKLNVEDIRIQVAPTTGKQFCELTISGKTGTRSVVLTDSLPYVKELLAAHPQSGNPRAPLFLSESDRNRGARLDVEAIWTALTKYRRIVFPKLLKSQDVSAEDKRIIEKMLQKPWNTYVHRHSSLTAACQVLSDANLRSYAGWSVISNMHQVYLHLSGQEGSKAMLIAKGIVTKGNEQSDKLQPKHCPNCSEPNTQNARFCSQCKMALNIDAYMEAVAEQKNIYDRLSKIDAQFQKLIDRQKD
jgi:integrase